MAHQIVESETVTALRLKDAHTPFTLSSNRSTLQLLASVERGRLNELLTRRECQTGEVIFKEGEPGNSVYIIWSGRVAVVKGDFDDPTVLAHRGAGEVLGEMALLEHAPRSASVVALEPTQLLALRGRDFQNLLTSTSDFGVNLLASLSRRLRASDEVVEEQTTTQRQMDAQLSTLASQREGLLRAQQLRAKNIDFLIHDMRNPLGVVYTAVTMLQIVLPEEILEENQDLFDIALTSCERLQRMVENVLELARMEEEGLTLHRQWVQPEPLLQKVLRRQWIGPKTELIHLDREIPKQLPAVRVDLDVIDRVLSNLLDNAVDYTPAGGTLLVSARQKGDEVEISVTDSGPGIPPERRESIFERFDRGMETTRRGFGLGLTFCKLAVEAHGGRIWVESGPEDVGSRFVFTLPVASEEEDG